MQDFLIGVWETNTKRIIAYAHHLGLDISARPKLNTYHLGLYELRENGDISLVKQAEYTLEANGFECDELTLNVICDWGTRIAKAKPRIQQLADEDDIGLVHFCFETSRQQQQQAPALKQDVYWNGIYSHGANYGRVVHEAY